MRQLLFSLFLLLFGLLLGIYTERLFLSSPLPQQKEQIKSSPPQPIDPEEARDLVIETLGSQLSENQVEHGLYPLRGAGRELGESLALISFPCSRAGCDAFLKPLEAQARRRGFQLIHPQGGDRPGRPLYRALLQKERPALALRLLPSGPLLTVVITGLEREEHLKFLLRLDPEITVALRAQTKQAPLLARRLEAEGREFILQLGGGSPSALIQRLQASLQRFPGAAGLGQGPPLSGSRSHMSALLKVLKEEGRLFLDYGGPASVAEATAIALGLRRASASHHLSSDDFELRLRDVEAALMLEGRALLLVPAEARTLGTLPSWLESLRTQGIQLLRLSEVVL